jgi:hypothetical protein
MNRRLSAASFSIAAFAAFGFTLVRSDSRVEERVDARIRASVAAIVDSLEREGLQPEPLVDYALEGTQKAGDPAKILAGVRKWATDLRRSRQLLGPNASPDEVNAGAKALRAGVDEAKLERLRVERTNQRYASSLSTIAYLVSSGVTADTASTVLVNIALAGASEAQIRKLQDEIQSDINRGMPPGASTVARAFGLLQAIEASRGNADGVVPGAALPSTRGTARPADPMANGTMGRSANGNQAPAPRGKDTKRPPP